MNQVLYGQRNTPSAVTVIWGGRECQICGGSLSREQTCSRSAADRLSTRSAPGPGLVPADEQTCSRSAADRLSTRSAPGPGLVPADEQTCSRSAADRFSTRSAPG